MYGFDKQKRIRGHRIPRSFENARCNNPPIEDEDDDEDEDD